MKILVANLGSTSFKYRLYDLGDPAEPLLARGAVERIGSDNARVTLASAQGEAEMVVPVPDHAAAVQLCLDQLTSPEFGVIADADDVAAIGFKAVHARNLTGVHRVDEALLDAMEAYADVAPAHNPPYVKAMRMLHARFPKLPLVAAFETGFHADHPRVAHAATPCPTNGRRRYGIRRWGFHGASHRYIAGRMATLLGRDDAKVISCHLGGSSSLCAIRDGQSVATQHGHEPAVRPAAEQSRRRLRRLRPARHHGRDRPDARRRCSTSSRTSRACSGISGFNDLRDIEAAADAGRRRRRRWPSTMFIDSVRHYLGAYLLELGGADAIVFTGGIGENSARVRAGVCKDLGWFGIEMDWKANVAVAGEHVVSAPTSRVQVWCVPDERGDRRRSAVARPARRESMNRQDAKPEIRE